jgi:hypothetical protein
LLSSCYSIFSAQGNYGTGIAFTYLRTNKPFSKEKAMKLTEILMSLVLAGALTTTQMDFANDVDDKGKLQTARFQVCEIGKALCIEQFRSGSFPAEEDFRTWLNSNTHGIEEAQRNRDPWGTALRYSRTEEGSFVLTCAGPDAEFGTADDIRYR